MGTCHRHRDPLAHPSAKLLVYYWNPPGGWEDTFVYGQKGAKAPLTYFW